jgi:UDP-N-acetylglucosamine--N-acetylmuramyl-(pentapeptide) pyrophosphoryl-undecaprenol N-acetylglucosamine transferase
MKIIFTGGGTAGHVTPNIALMQYFSAQKNPAPSFIYVGSYQGVEKKLVSSHVQRYYGISTGKLRRYKSWRNLLTPAQVILGTCQALGICSGVVCRC